MKTEAITDNRISLMISRVNLVDVTWKNDVHLALKLRLPFGVAYLVNEEPSGEEEPDRQQDDGQGGVDGGLHRRNVSGVGG